MNKKANTQFYIHRLLEDRWSPRSFRDEAIEQDKLNRIFEAARWAPSAFNEQPWRYIVGIKGADETFPKILEGLSETNKEWASKAPVLTVCLAKKTYTHNNHDNFHFLYDTGQSVAHLTFQAMHEGIFVHQMAGFYFEKIVASFKIPDTFYVATVFAMGYLGKPETLSEELYNKEISERSRKDFKETFYKQQFGISYF